MPQNSYLILGGGHIGLATAVYLSAQGHSVYLFSRRPSTLAQTKTIHSTGAISPGSYPITTCSHQMQELAVAHGGKLPSNVLLCCRGQDIEPYAKILAKYIYPQMNILMLCASRFAGRAFCQVIKRAGIKETQLPVVADVDNIPLVSRSNARDQVEISSLKKKCHGAAQNQDMTDRIVTTYQKVFSNLFPGNSFLEVNLNKCNDIIHVPLILASLNKWESGQDYNPYKDIGPRTAGLIAHLDRDRLAVGQALGLHNLIDICSYYRIFYGTKGPSLHEHMQQLEIYSHTTIGNPHHRYFVEDLPFGVFPLQVLARLLQIDTPFLDSCITLGSAFLGVSSPWTAEFFDFHKQQLVPNPAHVV